MRANFGGEGIRLLDVAGGTGTCVWDGWVVMGVVVGWWWVWCWSCGWVWVRGWWWCVCGGGGGRGGGPFFLHVTSRPSE